MPLAFFTIPVRDSEHAQDALNAFLAGRRILTTDRRFVEQGPDSFWAVCVDWLAGGEPGRGRGGNTGSRNRIDYKEILGPDEFTVFSRLRDLRKEIAAQEAVPVYAVLTNEQLARMVQGRCRTRAALGGIEGVGEARLEKYAERILEILAALPEAADAPHGRPV